MGMWNGNHSLLSCLHLTEQSNSVNAKTLILNSNIIHIISYLCYHHQCNPIQIKMG